MAFLVIEGLDGSGKSTQLNILREKLGEMDIPYRYLHFPRLEEGIYGKLVARFLRGELGANDLVHPNLVALIFAGDRAEAAPMIRSWLEEGLLVIVDRYVYSNIAFQCAKLKSRDERDRLRDWILDLEFSHNKLPRPDLNLYLNVPFSFTARQLGTNRNGTDRAYLKGERDIHEEDLEFQEKVRQEYLALQGRVDDIRIVECAGPSGEMLSPEKISTSIMELLNSVVL
jgi:dTMP kinase